MSENHKFELAFLALSLFAGAVLFLTRKRY